LDGRGEGISGDGCKVSFEEFEMPPGPRVVKGGQDGQCDGRPAGHDAEAADHASHVVGHYDSRNSDGNDSVGDAPGPMTKLPGTAWWRRSLGRRPGGAGRDGGFSLHTGEEQGLIGAKYRADKAKTQGEGFFGC